MAKEQEVNLVDMDAAALNAELNSLQHEYANMKFDHAVKGRANPMEIPALRRDVARVHTEIRRREIALMTPEQLELRSKTRARRRRK